MYVKSVDDTRICRKVCRNFAGVKKYESMMIFVQHTEQSEFMKFTFLCLFSESFNEASLIV